jgi:GT2 family glycosyltransferase
VQTARPADAPADDAAAGTVYVLTPVHDRKALTERFLRCLIDQTDRDYHLVLVDDGSRDGTAEMARSMIPSATIIRGSGNWWWAGSLEQARRWLLRQPSRPGDLVLIANDDTTFEADFLASARRAMGDADRTMLLARPYSALTGMPGGIGVHVNWRSLTFRPASTPEEIDCFSTRGLFLRRADFVALGAFHTRLLPHYLSDYEFTLRAARRGFRLRTDPSVRLVMDETTTGIRKRDRRSVGAYLRSVLTIRATKNPVYWSTFVILASPRRRIPANLVRVWSRFTVGLVRALRSRPAPAP